MSPAVLDLSPLPARYRARVQQAHAAAVQRMEEDRALSAAYDAAKDELGPDGRPLGCVNALDVVAERFGVRPSRVREAKWPDRRRVPKGEG